MNWAYEIKLKHLFNEDLSPEKIYKLCLFLIPQLEGIKKKVEESKIMEKEYLDECLFELIDHFDFNKQFCNGKIPESEWDDYEFDGNFAEMFNSYLEELYDLGNKQVRERTGPVKKFIWIN